MKNALYSRYLTYFLGFQIILVQILSRFPNTIENYYSTGLYVQIAAFYRRSLGWIPFSVGDLLYGLFVFLLIRFIYIIIRDKFSELRTYFFAIGASLSILYFFFYFSWGLNYYRTPLASHLKIDSHSYTTDKLLDYTKKLVEDLNELHVSITQNDSLKVTVPYSSKEIYKLAKNGYKNISNKHPFLNYKFKSVKNSLLSTPLTYMGFAGYLNPFTGEAQVNAKIPLSTYAFTTCHEMAHQLGYAAENEANFIGYLASTANKDLYFKYAGQLTALRYLLSEIYKRNPNDYKKIKSKINSGILSNINDIYKFWGQYENPFEPVFKKSYNAYLKINKQKNGIKSYSYMVNLLLNYQ